MPNYLLENVNVEIDAVLNNIIIDIVVDNNDPDTDSDYDHTDIWIS